MKNLAAREPDYKHLIMHKQLRISYKNVVICSFLAALFDQQIFDANGGFIGCL